MLSARVACISAAPAVVASSTPIARCARCSRASSSRISARNVTYGVSADAIRAYQTGVTHTAAAAVTTSAARRLAPSAQAAAGTAARVSDARNAIAASACSMPKVAANGTITAGGTAVRSLFSSPVVTVSQAELVYAPGSPIHSSASTTFADRAITPARRTATRPSETRSSRGQCSSGRPPRATSTASATTTSAVTARNGIRSKWPVAPRSSVSAVYQAAP